MSSRCSLARSLALVAVLLGAPLAFTTAQLPAPPARTTFPSAAQPQLAATADGRVFLAYGHGTDLFVARSDDAGATFAPPVKIASVSKLMLGMRRGPRLAVHGDRITVLAVGEELVAFRSADAGRTWSAPVTVNDTPRSAREGLHALASAPNGTLFATWLDLRRGKTELFGSTSADAGATWSVNTLVYRSPDGTICECCHPSAAFNARGDLAVMWRNSLAGARDPWLAVRPAGVSDFLPAAKLGDGTWALDACPMDGGAVIPAADGFAAAWQRDDSVYVSAPALAELPLGSGKQPVIAPLGSGQLVLWQRGADLWSAHLPSAPQPRLRLANARFPSLVQLPGGTRAVLACEQGPAVTVHVLDAADL